MSSIRAILLASAIGAVASSESRALTFDHQPPLHRMIAEASVAFIGTVETIDYGAAVVSERQSIPYENITFRVIEDLGGAGSGQITLRQMGGRLPGEETKYLVIPGLAEFVNGERIYIFHNSAVQPFFATLYGDASLFRVATDDTGAPTVMNAFWQPLLAGNGRVWPEPGMRCLPLEDDRSRCVRTEMHVHDVTDDEDVAAREGRPVTPAMFNRFVRSWRDPGSSDESSRPVDEATFVRALVAFGQQVSAPPAND